MGNHYDPNNRYKTPTSVDCSCGKVSGTLWPVFRDTPTSHWRHEPLPPLGWGCVGVAGPDTVNEKVEVKSTIDQPPPVKNERKPVWDAVIADMKERDEVGEKRYGVRLQPFNGRKALADAYAEGLDLVVYLKQQLQQQEEILQLAVEIEGLCLDLSTANLLDSHVLTAAIQAKSRRLRDLLQTNKDVR